jgi:pyruvate formate lyase activating enzyme
LLRCGEEGIHRAVDTSGYAKKSVIEDILSHTDLFLYDLKHLDADIHKKWVGVDNVIILENLRFIAESDKAYHIRIPLIEGVNATDENISETIDFLKSLKRAPDRVGLLPYHNIATNKYEKLGRVYDDEELSAPTKERQLEILNIFTDNGFNAVIGG